jgi:FkbM family methyltransferase
MVHIFSTLRDFNNPFFFIQALLKTNSFFSFLYNFLLDTYWCRRLPILSKIWNTLWKWQVSSYKGLVSSKLHGIPVILTNGHWYSLVCRQIPKFNQPLFALVEALSAKKKNLKVVDVGAAVGDTVLFLETNFPGKIEHYVCIDGDEEFFSFQEFNLAKVKSKSTQIFALLSDHEELVSAIDKKDPTTGSSIGDKKVMGKTLDKCLEKCGKTDVDLIKVDIDGFDGKALGGAIKTLQNSKPLVIFEWNPPLFELVGNDLLQPFQVLASNGYEEFLWFTNKGDFSHFEIGYQEESLLKMGKLCQALSSVNGHHFDIIALPQNGSVSAGDIAFINETKKQRNPY